MAENTAISWADHTWSPWYGCTQISMGEKGACVGCYARHMSETRFGRVVFGGPGRGEGTRDVRADSAWKEPLAWERKQVALWDAWNLYCDQRQTQWPVSPMSEPQPCFIFPSMCDPFDNHPALTEPRRRFFDLIRATPNLTWLLLTKRPGNILKLWEDVRLTSENVDVDWDGPTRGWPRNAAIGCTIVTQEEADRDIPKLLAAKAALNPAFAFLSMEPLLGPVDLTRCFHNGASGFWARHRNYLTGASTIENYNSDEPIRIEDEGVGHVDWVITGGETDQGAHKARPADPEWFRSLRDQCAAAGVPFHFKQWGEWQPGECVTRQSGVVQTATAMANGDWWFDEENLADTDGHVDDEADLYRVGNANDPGTLDGVRHAARP